MENKRRVLQVIIRDFKGDLSFFFIQIVVAQISKRENGKNFLGI